ncbi:MAG: sialidase family protein [Candidatus Dormibacteria bacterium]
MRGSWLRAVALALFTLGLTGSQPLSAASVATVDVNPGSPAAAWTGGPLTGSGENLSCSSAGCDTLKLTAEVPAGAWGVVHLSVQPDDQHSVMRINWCTGAGACPNNSVIGVPADIGASGGGNDHAVLTIAVSGNASGTVQVVCDLCAAATYHGTARLEVKPPVGANLPLTANPAGLSFTDAQVTTGGFEPRIAVGPGGRRWLGTQDPLGNEQVFSSTDGASWHATPLKPPGGAGGCCDNDMVVTRTGRVIAAIISRNLNFDIEYSDDGGETWSTSQLTGLADQDREWLAVGPDDASTGLPTVYMLWHNLVTGSADHEMLVSTSKDNGATFGPPIPVTTPGNQAWLDLQCADSGGPSNIFVNPRSGQVYALFGTRSSTLGGCGASALGPFEINVVAATRAWVATSTDEGMTWSDSLAVDDSATGNIVGAQLQAGAVDAGGNVYVLYPESPNPYPDYNGAAMKYVHADAAMTHWSRPVTVAAPGGVGHTLPYIVAGDPGHLGIFYMTGYDPGDGSGPQWFPEAAVTTDGLDAGPTISENWLANIPTWSGTESQVMGYCAPYGSSQQPPADILNALGQGFTCGRGSDVLGMSLDSQCHFMVTWYASPAVAGPDAGTHVSTQSGGPALGGACGVAGQPAAPVAAAPPGGGTLGRSTSPAILPNTAGAPGPGPATWILLLPAALLAALHARARRRGVAIGGRYTSAPWQE